MANIKSQIKRNRQNDKRRLRNRVVRGDTRATIKKAHAAIETGNAETSKVAIQQAVSALDKAAEKGVLHKNNVARRKSRLMKKLAALPPASAVEQPVAAVAEPEPAAPKKAAPRKRTATPRPAEEPAVEVEAAEAPASKAKKPAAKKPAAAKADTKKTAAKKTSAKASPKAK